MFQLKSAFLSRTVLLLGLCGLTACGSIMDSDKVNYKTQTDAPPVASLEVPPI